MKKILIFSLFILSFALFAVGCDNLPEQGGDKSSDSYKKTEITLNAVTGELGDFSLVAPVSGAEEMYLPSFSWTASQNAATYELELCSSESFATDSAVYVKKTGIISTEFTLTSAIKEKNAYYFWRVTAVNSQSRKTSAVGNFYYKADEREIEFDVNYADEWSVHEQGSNATVSVENGDFFGNGKNSLVVGFVEEDVKRGIPSSDGWIVVTHSQETEMYGVDAFYFNFYYSGNDSDIFLRVVDEDNEYWHARIKLANNAKQTVIIKFEDFELRTKGGTTIANQVFDYNYIKYVELVFEKSFGDGVAMISDLKAVKYDNYRYLFIDEFNFNDVSKDRVILDNYNFGTEYSDDGKAVTYSFSKTANEQNATGINGYGFVKFPIEKLLVNGDCFLMNIGYTGALNSVTVLVRIIEEDGDRWVYRQKLSTLPESGKLVVPYMAFTLSEYQGDGSRQFYYVKQLQLGLEGAYATGSITVSDIKVAYMAEEVEGLYRSEIGDNGVIDDFNGYTNNVEAYYKWMLSDTNKDEAISIEKDLAFGSGNACGKLGYKADMGQAMYGTAFDSPKKYYNAVSFWAMDRSVKSDNAAFNYLSDVSAQMIVALYVNTGEEYHAVINSVDKYWTEYTISFDDFTLSEGFYGDVTPLTSENVVAIRLGFQYYYYAKYGEQLLPYPVYVSSNFVYVDNIGFTVAEESSERELMKKLVPSAENDKICVVADFDEDTEETFAVKGEKGYEYESVALSTTTATGSGNSAKMNYRGNSDSVAYGINTVIDESVSANSIKVLIKGDGKATVYINVYMVFAGAAYKYRATLTQVSEEWTVYTIGFDNFEKIEGSGSVALSRSKVRYITKITFGMVNSSDGELSCIYVDKITLDGTIDDRQGGTTRFEREQYVEGGEQI